MKEVFLAAAMFSFRRAVTPDTGERLGEKVVST